jgi:peroxiredoxin
MSSDIRASVAQAFTQARDLDGSMNERLGLFVAAVRELHPESDAIVERLITRLHAHNAGDTAPRPGEAMPPFALPDETGRLVTLAGLLKSGPAVITFHRGHWCPFCRISMNTLARALPRIEAAGARMVAIVPDRQQFAEEMKADTGARFPILTDMDNGYAMSLDLAIWIGDELKDYLMRTGRSLPAYQGNDAWLLPVPATFVVAPDGRIKARFVDPDYRRRADIEQIIEALT